MTDQNDPLKSMCDAIEQYEQKRTLSKLQNQVRKQAEHITRQELCLLSLAVLQVCLFLLLLTL